VDDANRVRYARLHAAELATPGTVVWASDPSNAKVASGARLAFAGPTIAVDAQGNSIPRVYGKGFNGAYYSKTLGATGSFVRIQDL
jgi:hypothetical protein